MADDNRVYVQLESSGGDQTLLLVDSDMAKQLQNDATFRENFQRCLQGSEENKAEDNSCKSEEIMKDDNKGEVRWQPQATQLLVSMRIENDVKFHMQKTHSTLWDEISAVLKEKGHIFTGKQCSNKWKSLKRDYRAVVDHNSKTGSDKKTFACPAGTRSIDDVCAFCEKGKYQSNAGQTTCESCLDGRTTNAIGSKDSSQCIIESTSTKKPPSGKRPRDDDDDNNTVMIAIAISVTALVIALFAIVMVWYKKFRPKTSINCSTGNLRVESCRTRFTRSGRGWPAPPTRTVTAMSQFDPNDYQRGSDSCRTPGPHVRVASANSIRIDCQSPPPYEADLPVYTEKDLTCFDNTYAVINDSLPGKN